jgi:2,3-dihydroxybenzoate decarboxylase
MVDIEGRIKLMDEAGIEMQVLSLTSPGCQGLTDAKEAEDLAREANECVASFQIVGMSV